MAPREFLSELKAKGPRPVYLFLGPEYYQRRTCTDALISAALPRDGSGSVARHDLAGMLLEDVLADARALSLFSPDRVLFVQNGENALPKGRAASDEEGKGKTDGAERLLAEYAANPTPGVTLVFEAVRYEFTGEDKAKLERVKKFYGGIPNHVEFRPFSISEARNLAQKLAARAKLNIGETELDLLVEALGGDAARIAQEIEKLALCCEDRPVTPEILAEITPDAREESIFALVDALGNRDRLRALDILDTLIRQGEYLPLALSFLGNQFRHALTAKEAGLKDSYQIQGHFQKMGIQMWKSKADQIAGTVRVFPAKQLALGIGLLYEADKALRSARPDDRTVVEELVFRLTAS